MEDRLDSYFADSDSGEPPVTKPFFHVRPCLAICNVSVHKFCGLIDGRT